MGLELWVNRKGEILFTEKVDKTELYLVYYSEKEYFIFGFTDRTDFENWMKKKNFEKADE